MDEEAVVADRMVGPGGTVDSCFRVAFCLLRSKFCMSCFGKIFYIQRLFHEHELVVREHEFMSIKESLYAKDFSKEMRE
jgi:hypothetical protein